MGQEDEAGHEEGEADGRVLGEFLHLLQEPGRAGGGAAHLATLTSRASFRMSTEVRVSWVQEREVGEVDEKDAEVDGLTIAWRGDGEGGGW